VRAWLAIVLAGCAAAPSPAPGGDAPTPLDRAWASIRRGDAIVAVVGTGGYTLLGAMIDAAARRGSPAVVSQQIDPSTNPIVLEQAIGAAQRAGLSDQDIETRAVSLGLWGAGVTSATSFVYESLGGLRVTFDVIGGESACAVGALFDNLGSYTNDSADKDARDLYARAQAYAGARRLVLVAHSWGGAVAEHLVHHLASIRSALGGAATMPLVVAAGVPGAILGEGMDGPGARFAGDGLVYEIDRPDDPVHALDPSGDIEGHEYDIVIGGVFEGSYGITTTELACRGVPGPCAR
jgi:hypothetical protein